MDETPTKTRLQKSKEKKSVTADDSLILTSILPDDVEDEKGESDSDQPLKEMKMKAMKDTLKRKEVSEDGKGESDGDQQQKETRTSVKHDTVKKKKKVSDPEATTPSRKSQRLKDQVSPSSPKPEAEKKTKEKTNKKVVSDRQAEEQLIANISASKATKRKKKAEKDAPKEVLDDDTENEDDTDDFEKAAAKEAVKQVVDKQKKKKKLWLAEHSNISELASDIKVSDIATTPRAGSCECTSYALCKMISYECGVFDENFRDAYSPMELELCEPREPRNRKTIYELIAMDLEENKDKYENAFQDALQIIEEDKFPDSPGARLKNVKEMLKDIKQTQEKYRQTEGDINSQLYDKVKELIVASDGAGGQQQNVAEIAEGPTFNLHISQGEDGAGGQQQQAVEMPEEPVAEKPQQPAVDTAVAENKEEDSNASAQNPSTPATQEAQNKEDSNEAAEKELNTQALEEEVEEEFVPRIEFAKKQPVKKYATKEKERQKRMGTNQKARNSAWSIRKGEDPYLWDIRIHGDVIRHLMNNKYLEEQVLRYYSYRLFRKQKYEQEADSIDKSWAIDANEDIWDDAARQCDEAARQCDANIKVEM
ncbi:eukaryotic translation initiation factor 5B-like [Papaver somniferum]|uniref:eukaryotic translation initiation factor 5B-like n=1 Tax=Papaver somniferum TaxID=3469 RepID=UPI000E705B9D|nr:eukaryotic translation initiation factor 5B-like [Papaver somniferum]